MLLIKVIPGTCRMAVIPAPQPPVEELKVQYALRNHYRLARTAFPPKKAWHEAYSLTRTEWKDIYR